VKLELVRVLDDEGRVVHPARMPACGPAELVKLYETMRLVRGLDERLLRLQRQGRIAFYLTATGEEATHVGPTWALRPGDWIYSSYREIGAALFRGYPLRTLLCQLLGNAEDPVKGRQMPVHHTARNINFVSISSPVGTQIPQAVGTAMAARIAGKDDVALVYFGDGATSTGAFHVACNFAAVRKAPCLFLCRNNGWAISSPRSIQTATPTFAQKAIAYGMPGILVDGNDVLALAQVTAEAAARARRGEGPTLIEARTYRRGAHSSSDDPSVYRDPSEPGAWEAHDPIARFGRYLRREGLASDAGDAAFDARLEEAFARTLAEVEHVGPPTRATLFDDVFGARPWHLEEQATALEAEVARRPGAT
jgi:pyruvate dehydrogenase E1 component alpha subunit/2-oxoisovalerate dehydrogenase E1 component alpha subunit